MPELLLLYTYERGTFTAAIRITITHTLPLLPHRIQTTKEKKPIFVLRHRHTTICVG
jgi:hypothetical protein